MALDPNIALGVRGIELPNQLAQYGQLAQIQNAQNQNALAQFQLSSAQRSDEQQNQLYAAAKQPGFKLDLQTAIQYGPAGIAALKSQQEATTARLNQEKLTGEITAQPVKLSADKAKLLDDKLKLSRQFLDTLDPSDPNAPAKYLAWHEANHADPDIGPALLARGVTADQARMQIDAAIAKGPADFAKLLNQSKLGTEKFMEMNKPTTQVVDQSGQRQVLQIPGLGGAPTSVGTYADVPLPAAVEAQKSRIAKAGASNIRIDQKQESAFESGLGAGQSKLLLDSKIAAKDAASIIDTVKTGRDIMKSGMITGAGADFLVNLNQGLKTAGIDSGYADASANSQAFAANMAGNVGKLIKQFGAGTGLSDADREFAKDMAGGRVSLDSKAINKILDINEKAARNTITQHNKDVKGIKTNIPLEVELPPEVKTPVVNVPSSAIDYLRANPGMKSAFDAKYGAGAADRALKGQ